MPDDREQQYEYSSCYQKSEYHRAGVVGPELDIGSSSLALGYLSYAHNYEQENVQLFELIGVCSTFCEEFFQAGKFFFLSLILYLFPNIFCSVAYI